MTQLKSGVLAILGAALLLGSGLQACSVFRGNSTPGQFVDDVAITSQIKTELLDSKKVDGLDVEVDTKNGHVTLTGWASSSSERSKAGEIAASVKGVKAVDNRIKIKS